MLFAASLFLFACNKSEDVELDFNITFPDNWSYYVYANEGYIMDAARNATSSVDTMRESLVVYKSHFASSTLPLYYATLKAQIVQSDSYDFLLYESDTVINTLNFKKLLSAEHFIYINEVSEDTTNVDAVTTRYFVYHNDYGYNLTFIAVDTAYEANKQIFEDIMSSFTFK